MTSSFVYFLVCWLVCQAQESPEHCSAPSLSRAGLYMGLPPALW